MAELDKTAAAAPETPPPWVSLYEVRVRPADSPETWYALAHRPADINRALELAARRALGQAPFDGMIPAEVLVVGEFVPVDRWLDGQHARLESLTPCHPGGCSCGECCIRWAHREHRPGHEPCTHGGCRLCDGCTECDWDEARRQYQDYAARKLTEAADGIDQALRHVADAGTALRDLEREEREVDCGIDSLEPRGVEAVMDKLNRAAEQMQDAARIFEVYQLRRELAARGGLIP